jgi:hypothetical protein
MKYRLVPGQDCVRVVGGGGAADGRHNPSRKIKTKICRQENPWPDPTTGCVLCVRTQALLLGTRQQRCCRAQRAGGPVTSSAAVKGRAVDRNVHGLGGRSSLPQRTGAGHDVGTPPTRTPRGESSNTLSALGPYGPRALHVAQRDLAEVCPTVTLAEAGQVGDTALDHGQIHAAPVEASLKC